MTTEQLDPTNTSLAPPAGTRALHPLDRLVEIMRRLLAPDGCPWDRKQTLDSLKPFLVEEAYEVIEAIEEGEPRHHAEELGDLLFQIVFQAALAKLTLPDIIEGISSKLIRRHPHVFGDVAVKDADEVLANWEQIKQAERGAARGPFDGLPIGMPPLERTRRIVGKAVKLGFDWPDEQGARQKLAEELRETYSAVDQGAALETVEHELGDVLFASVVWARKLGVDPERALRRANRRFCERFAGMQQSLATDGLEIAQTSLDTLLRHWQEAKRALRRAAPTDDDGLDDQ